MADLSPSSMTYLFDRHSEITECLGTIVGDLPSKIQICSGEGYLVQRLSQGLFPKGAGPEQWARLAGVGEKTGMVEVGHFRGGLWLEFYEPGEKRFHGVLRLFRHRGEPVVRIDSLRIRPRFQRIGLGKTIFLRQMTAASELGFKKSKRLPDVDRAKTAITVGPVSDLMAGFRRRSERRFDRPSIEYRPYWTFTLPKRDAVFGSNMGKRSASHLTWHVAVDQDKSWKDIWPIQPGSRQTLVSASL